MEIRVDLIGNCNYLIHVYNELRFAMTGADLGLMDVRLREATTD